MRVGFYLADLRRAQNDSQGTVNYAIGLLRALPQALSSADELFVLANPEIAGELGKPDGWTLELTPVPRSLPRRLYSDHVLSQLWARRISLDVIHFPKGHVPLLWRPHLFGDRHSAVVGTLHDDIAVQYDRGALGPVDSRVKRRYFAWAVIHSARHADQVLTVSEFSAHQIRGLTTRPIDRVTVTYEGSALPELPFVPSDQRDHTILLFGSIVAHKQTTRTIGWILRYLAERQSRLSLTVLGKIPPDAEALVMNSRVRPATGVLSNDGVARLLGRARALVFGSVYEGFGLPPVEAYMLGTPALYARTTAVEEIMHGFSGGFDPDDYRSFASAFDDVLTLSDDALESASCQMRQRYAWDEVARRTVVAYRTSTWRCQGSGKGA